MKKLLCRSFFCIKTTEIEKEQGINSPPMTETASRFLAPIGTAIN